MVKTIDTIHGDKECQNQWCGVVFFFDVLCFFVFFVFLFFVFNITNYQPFTVNYFPCIPLLFLSTRLPLHLSGPCPLSAVGG